MAQQQEFYFTQTGAMQIYNNLQRAYIDMLYVPHRGISKKDFLTIYMQAGAKKFEDKYRHHIFTDLVEFQTDSAKDLWKCNELHSGWHGYHKLETLVLKHE